MFVSPESGPAPSGAAASGTGCGPLRHTSSARPRSAFLSAPVFSRKPRSLCRKPARHSTLRIGRSAMLQAGRKQAFQAEGEPARGGARAGNTPKAGLREGGALIKQKGGAWLQVPGAPDLSGSLRGGLGVSAAAVLTGWGWGAASGRLLHLRRPTNPSLSPAPPPASPAFPPLSSGRRPWITARQGCASALVKIRYLAR